MIRRCSTELYLATIKNRQAPFRPQSGDIEGGVIKTLEKEGVPIPFSHGKHRWIRHANPPSPHHPEGSVVLWADQKQRKSLSSRIQPWNGDNSWITMMQDSSFCAQTDEYLDKLQQNPELRAYHFLGFPTQQEKEALKKKRLQKIVSEYGAQSQSRTHIHIVLPVHPNHPSVSTVPVDQLARDSLVIQKLFDFAARRSVHEFKSELNGFGSPVEYTQAVGTQKISVPRKFFEFKSWQEALKSIFELKQDIASHWLDHAYAVCSQSEQFLGHALSMQQTLSCIPVFALVRPSKIDQKQLKKSTKWLVLPFSLEIPSSMFGPGVVLNRVG